MHSLVFAKSMMQEGSTLVCTDISDKMVTSAKGRFENPKNDYLSNQLNKTHFDTDHSGIIDIYEERQKHTKDPTDRLVLGFLANAMELPFRDEAFDCYIANLSLHLVPDYKAQIKEAARVLEKSGRAAFAIPGRKVNSPWNMTIGKFFLKY